MAAVLRHAARMMLGNRAALQQGRQATSSSAAAEGRHRFIDTCEVAAKCHPDYLRWAAMSREEQLEALLCVDPLTVPENIRKTVEERNKLCILILDKYPHMIRHVGRLPDQPCLASRALFIVSTLASVILLQNKLGRKGSTEETDPSIIHGDSAAKS
ncbi:uncharacterized protein LOC119349174 [Triticum dicoccoides]|uniref:uncharacterized protein LOC119349174 n=1 Tax=Triticum dicoccoides TaxID=85692 RepID=UPI001890AC94|nr:uncharacterized protein LOC119349174 [Triticum dicoccoides]XP_044451677.1 uncharacterized protein LOC123183017 [Triticum aestivum]